MALPDSGRSEKQDVIAALHVAARREFPDQRLQQVFVIRREPVNTRREDRLHRGRNFKVIERVCGEIQLRRRPGSERGRCSVFASGMSQGLRLDAQERHCAELG